MLATGCNAPGPPGPPAAADTAEYLVAATTAPATTTATPPPTAAELRTLVARMPEGWLDGSGAGAAAGAAAPPALTQPPDEALLPADLAPLTLSWPDPTPTGTRAWLLTLELPACATRLHVWTPEPRWLPDPATWERIKRCSREQPARVGRVGLGRGEPPALQQGARATRFGTSPDPVAAPIFYRDVPVPFLEALAHMEDIRWRLGDPASAEPPRVVLEKLPVCGNCHSFSADGRLLGMDVDYANDKGAYAVVPVLPETVLAQEQVISWSDLDRDATRPTFGLLSQLSPDGRYVVSTVRDRSLFIPRSDPVFSQLFFPVQGILAVYDRETKTFAPLPGADDPDFVQSNPSFSPDGRELIFARAPLQHEILRRIAGETATVLTRLDSDEFTKPKYHIQYDLYRLPFNEGRGGTAQPLAGASGNGRSNYFARYSPDGRWIAFARAPTGMLLQPGSELFLLPAGGGVPRRLRGNQSRMNSWHSWSPNGRWLVFAAKGDSPYTQLYLAHVDEQGQDAPAVLLERFGAEGRAANIPEFAPGAARRILRITERFVDDHSYLRLGLFSLDQLDRPARAEAELRRALAHDPANAQVLDSLARVRDRRGDRRGALELLERSVRVAPQRSQGDRK
ncbi:MAG: hypothetical protein RBU45_26305, partial [Myxococcota bacterium]|nr:hypothetical protein [Myxococcota bacterium]